MRLAATGREANKTGGIMLKRIMAMVFALGISATASANTCHYDFTAERGEDYSLDHIVAFVTEEIRPRLGNENTILDIHITERCPGKKPVVNTLGMNTKISTCSLSTNCLCRTISFATTIACL